jgi:hypothetical protein
MAGFGRGKIYEEYYKPYVVSTNTANTTFYTFLIHISLHSNAPKLFGVATTVTVKTELPMNLIRWNLAVVLNPIRFGKNSL